MKTESRWGEIIRSTRESLRLTQGFVAERAGLSQGYFSQIEAGAVDNPSIETVRRIAYALSMPLHYFLRRAGIDCGCGSYEGELEPLEEAPA